MDPEMACHFQSETIHLENSHFDPRLDLILISPNQPLGLARTHGRVGGCSPRAELRQVVLAHFS